MEKSGVQFASFREPYLSTPDLDDANASLARNLLLGGVTSLAEFGSRRKSERVRVGMREIREGDAPRGQGSSPRSARTYYTGESGQDPGAR
jgi:hypothetical protein